MEDSQPLHNTPNFKTLFESAPGLYLVLDPALIIVGVSDAYLRATMTWREDIIGRALFEVFPDNPDDPQASGVSNLSASLNRVIRNRVPDVMAVQKYDIRRPESEGGGFEERFWSPVNSPVLGEQGELLYIIHRVEDVTDFIRLKQLRSDQYKLNEDLRARAERMEAEIYLRAQELQEANKQLLIAKEELEQRVQERTADLKAAADAMRASEESYRLLFDANPHPMWVYDVETLKFVAVNSAAIDHYGYSAEEFKKMSIFDIRPAEEVPTVIQAIRDLSPEPTKFVFRKHRKKDGTIIEVEGTSREVVLGKRRARLVLANDITDRKRAAEARERLAAIVSSSQDAIISKTLEGQVLSWNAGAERLYGYKESEALGRHISFLVPSDRSNELAEIFETLKKSRRVEYLETLRMRKDGSPVEVSISISPIMGDGGVVVGAATIARDITERKRIERELRSSEERYHDLVENAHDIIYTHDLAGNYTSVNKAGERITGYTREETLSMNLAQMVAPESIEGARNMMQRKLSGETETIYELEIVAKDGHRVAVEVNTRLIYQDGVPVGIQGIGRDITERKLLEQQLRQSQKLEAIGQLAGGVAHDFNNLLTAIIGFSDLLLRQVDEDAKIRAEIEEISSAGKRAAALTSQLLAFSRRQVLQPVLLDLNDVVVNIEKMLRRLIGEDIDIATVTEARHGWIRIDPGQTEQILMNLALNARDAMPNGGKLTIETSNVELDETYTRTHPEVVPGRYVLLAVSDTGLGIDADTQSHIFEPFFTTKDQGKGTGLGLSTVYGIVKQSGGHIWVYSEPGHGATFKVYLPRVDAVESQMAPSEAAKSLEGSERILLVEDDEGVRTLARLVLEEHGYTVFSAENGPKAIETFGSLAGTIDLVITDVIMPLMSGAELAKRLGDMHSDLRVLYVSGYTEEATIHRGVLDEGVEFLQKPFTPQALARKVREVIERG